MNIRFVVCIDYADCASVVDAYRKLRQQLPPECAYETTDEFFIDGVPGAKAVLDAARLAVLAQEEEVLAQEDAGDEI